MVFHCKFRSCVCVRRDLHTYHKYKHIAMVMLLLPFRLFIISITIFGHFSLTHIFVFFFIFKWNMSTIPICFCIFLYRRVYVCVLLCEYIIFWFIDTNYDRIQLMMIEYLIMRNCGLPIKLCDMFELCGLVKSSNSARRGRETDCKRSTRIGDKLWWWWKKVQMVQCGTLLALVAHFTYVCMCSLLCAHLHALPIYNM